MDGKIWDERYSIGDYVYGVQPNDFFKSFIDKNKPGSILLPAEGEGRNAVYAATKGWKVTAFDISKVAKDKALKLAQFYNVCIDYIVSDINKIELLKNDFDAIAFIYMHLLHQNRKLLFDKLLLTLKSGGNILFEAFEKKQLNLNSGGPKDEKLLYSEDEVEAFFENLSEIRVWKEIINIDEGILHHGEACVVRAIGKK